MKSKRVVLLLTPLLVVAALIAFGPRTPLDTTLRPVVLPDDLDAYLLASEGAVDDLRPGVEKTVVWATPERTRTPVALVYLHGFSATRQETAPLCDTLARRLGANLFYTRLSGHGRSAEALGEPTVNDWLNDGAEALAIGQRLGEHVVVIGTSTGATLAAWLLTQPHLPPTRAAVLISPNFHPKDGKAAMLTWPWGLQLAHLILGEYWTWEPYNAQQEQFWNTRYPSSALVTMMGLVGLVEQTDLRRITTPTLVIYSPDDQVVSPAYVTARFPEIGASQKRLIRIDEGGGPSHHVLAGNILSPATTLPLADSILHFLQPLLPAQ